jgi:uncharacterized MnhB-related membrane protein
MTRVTRFRKAPGVAALATIGGLGLMLVNEYALLDTSRPLVASAEAVIGRPVTPMSYAGVARRTTRRAVAVGAAAGAAASTHYYRAPGCVQVVNAYGQIVYQCP